MIYFSHVFGKDRHGYVRTNGKRVVPLDLWRSKSQVQIQKLIDEVQRRAQVEIQSIKERMQEEMEVRIKEQVKAMKVEPLNNFKFVFTQLQSGFSEEMVLEM